MNFNRHKSKVLSGEKYENCRIWAYKTRND